MSYPNHKVFVITNNPDQSAVGVEFYGEDLKSLVEKLKTQEGKNIFCDGGANLVNQLLKDELIDEFVISIVPVLLGDGIRLFQKAKKPQYLELISTQQFETGLAQLKYIKK